MQTRWKRNPNLPPLYSYHFSILESVNLCDEVLFEEVDVVIREVLVVTVVPGAGRLAGLKEQEGHKKHWW